MQRRLLFRRRQVYQPQRRWLTTAHTLAVWIREDLTTLAGAAVANSTGHNVLVWHGVPGDANANPFEVITGVAIAASHIDVQISATGLALFDPITYSLVGLDGNPLLTRYTMRTIIPSYE